MEVKDFPRTRKQLLFYLWRNEDLLKRNVNVFKEGRNWIASLRLKDGRTFYKAMQVSRIDSLTFDGWERRILHLLDEEGRGG